MDNAAQKLLESATHRTLHSTGFSRSSTQASLVLTDLLSRYLTLLTSTCAKYAQHSGRTRISPLDALSTLDGLGVSLDELKDFGSTEGLELNRYAIQSARRTEDLHEFRDQLLDGLKQDHDDVIPLHYGLYEGPEEDEEEEEEEVEDEDAMNVDDAVVAPETRAHEAEETRNVRPILPLSPISNPASPPRKRQRTLDWQPPPHVPDFLPPFPSMDAAPSPPAEPDALLDDINRQPSPAPAALPAQALTSSSSADWLLQVPYQQSSLSSQSEFHLPGHLPDPPDRVQKLPTPNTEQALLAAYRHILLNKQPPPGSVGTSTPMRHKVAMSLLALTQSSSRWEPADTLFSNLATNQPRVTAMGPAHPVPVNGAKDKDFKYPTVSNRAIIVNERLSNVVSQQSSRIPELAKQILPPKIYNRASRMTHPPALMADKKALTYGTGIPASWNTGPAAKDDPPSTSVLPDARLFATWDAETKSFKEQLKSRGNRGKGTVVHAARRGSRHV